MEGLRGAGRVHFIGQVEEVGDETSRIRIFPEYAKGLYKLEDYSHIIVLYWLHLRDNEKDRSVLRVIPRAHEGAPEVGVFSSRSPSRPNPIGLCVVKLARIEKNILTVEGLDALVGSPIVDIKPYLPRAEMVADAKVPQWAERGPRT
jgi:tRNA-Thr(GGU) m(6)t(6)A37 methyltransferase TsaA